MKMEELQINEDLEEAHRLQPCTIYTFQDAFVEYIKKRQNRKISIEENVSDGCKNCVLTSRFSQETMKMGKKENFSDNSIKETNNACVEYIPKEKRNPFLQFRESKELLKVNVKKHNIISKTRAEIKKEKQFRRYRNSGNVKKIEDLDKVLGACDALFNEEAKDKSKNNISGNFVEEIEDPKIQSRREVRKITPFIQEKGNYKLVNSDIKNQSTVTKKMIKKKKKNFHTFGNLENVLWKVNLSDTDVNTRDNMFHQSAKNKNILNNSVDETDDPNMQNYSTINHSNEDRRMSLSPINKKSSQTSTDKLSCGFPFTTLDNSRVNKSLRKGESKENVLRNCIEKQNNIETISSMLDDIKTFKLSRKRRIADAEIIKSNSTAKKKRKTASEHVESYEKFIDSIGLPGKKSGIDLNKSPLSDSSSDVICISSPRSNRSSFKNNVKSLKKTCNKKTSIEHLVYKESTGDKISKKGASSSKVTKIYVSDVDNEEVTVNNVTTTLSENNNPSSEINFSNLSQKRTIVDVENTETISNSQKKIALESSKSYEEFPDNTGFPGKESSFVIDLENSPPSNYSSDVICISSPRSKDRFRTPLKHHFEPIKRIYKNKTRDGQLTNNDSTGDTRSKKDVNSGEDIVNISTDEDTDNDSLCINSALLNKITFKSCKLQLMTSKSTSLSNKGSENHVSAENASNIDMTFGNGTLNQDVILSDDELNINISKSKSELECETKYDKRLKEVLSKTLTSNKLGEMCFQDLHLVLSHEVPLLHLADALPFRLLRKEEKVLLKSLGMREEEFSDSEDSILMENWEKFSKMYDVPDPALFLDLRKKKFTRVRKKFLQFLGNGLPHRALYQIYQRFCRLCHSSQYSKDEDKMILKVVAKNIEEPYSVLSCVLKRSPQSICKRYMMLKIL